MPTTTKDKYGRDRDNQRQRLYDAERACFEVTTKPAPSKAGIKFLHDGPKVRTTGNVSMEACQSYLDHVSTAAWFQTRWGRRRFTAIHKVHGNATGGNGNVTLPPWGRNEWVILHEMAHTLVGCDGPHAVHGPEFAGVFLTLVRYQMGTAAAAALRAAFKAHRVRYSMSKVPSPGTREVKPRHEIDRQKVAARRSLAERNHREIVGIHRRRQAAETLRTLVKDGHFGPAGAAARKSALAAARGLEGK